MEKKRTLKNINIYYKFRSEAIRKLNISFYIFLKSKFNFRLIFFIFSFLFSLKKIFLLKIVQLGKVYVLHISQIGYIRIFYYFMLLYLFIEKFCVVRFFMRGGMKTTLQ